MAPGTACSAENPALRVDMPDNIDINSSNQYDDLPRKSIVPSSNF